MIEKRKTTGEYIQDLADKTLETFVKEQPSGLFDHQLLRGKVYDTLMEFYEMKFPGCRACADEGYHLARAEMLADVISSIEKDAASLWIKGQDREAHYLRDVVAAPFRSKRAEEVVHATKFGAGFHHCTLTGLHP